MHDVHLDVAAGADRRPAAPLPDDPFRIAFIGDFSGRVGRADAAPAIDSPVLVDRDDLDDVLSRFAPRLVLTLGDGTEVALDFEEIEDFHADRLYERASFFRALRETRKRLADPGTFSDTLSAILGGPDDALPDTHTTEADDVVADLLSGSVLDRMVGTGRADPFQHFLRGIVAPHVVPGRDPARDALVDQVDASIADGLRQVLHHPHFQALEAIWRSVDFLVRRLETGTSLKLFLIDTTIGELRADDRHFARLLDRADAPWSALLLDHAFAATDDDISLLRTLARTAASRGAPLLAGASPSLAGLDDLASLPDANDITEWQGEAWHAFRRDADAIYAGLVLPRILLRLPYGEDGEPCDRLPFEELPAPPAHEHFLWGNGAVAATLLLGEAFTREGWRMQPGMFLDVAGLPLHTWRGPDGPEIKPCAECLMSDRAADALMGVGPMVLASIKHGDTARLVRMQCVAASPRSLAGAWGQGSGRG